MINQCKEACRLCVTIPNWPHFDFVLKFLWDMGYIRYYRIKDINAFRVFPKYTHNRIPVLTNFRVVTKPSNRKYVTLRELKSLVHNHRPSMTHYILSTRKGFMTAQEAYRQRIGGELMYEIW